MEPPVLMAKTRIDSLAAIPSTTRYSFEPRLDRSQTFPIALSSVHTSPTDTPSSFYTHHVSLPPRSSSWDGSSYRAVNNNQSRTPPLLRPRRLSSGARLKATPGEATTKLPKEILILMFTELRRLHLESEDESPTCATCYMRDMCSLSLTNRKWSSAAKMVLYETIILVGMDSPSHLKKKFKMKFGTRLKLLRRTLRANAQLSGYVKSLKVPDIPEVATTKKEQDNYLDIVASVIMACPNLERLVDFHIPYCHEFSRLRHALSSRSHLLEHVWNIVPNLMMSGQEPPPDNSDSFAFFHTNWANLQTLVIHCAPNGFISPAAFANAAQYLPSLTRLSLSDIPNLPPESLYSLPPLTSICLRNLPTIQPNHLSTFASTSAARSITSLVLVDMNLNSLPVLARLFANLRSLTRFTFQQEKGPYLPPGDTIFLHPYLASRTLKYLHWDILMPQDNDPNDATAILAKAINGNGFPNLRQVRAPCDYDGIIQSLCRPRASVKLASDHWMSSVTASRPDLSGWGRKDSGIAMANGDEATSPSGRSYNRSLRTARQAAQLRIDVAQLRPRFSIICEDWSNTNLVRITAKSEVGGYIGRIGSNIEYGLEPDLDGSDEALVRIEDLLRGHGRGSIPGTCKGLWNDRRKDCEHTERVQWRELPLGKIF